jgi:hypothetical protein
MLIIIGILNFSQNEMKQSITLIILTLIMGVKIYAQDWIYNNEAFPIDSVFFSYGDAVELSDGRISASAVKFFRSGVGDFYTTHPAVMLLSHNGTLVAQNDFFRPGYWGSTNPFVFERDGELFALTSYSPDHDSTYFNYFMNYDDPPTDAIIALFKLDDKLHVLESYEHSFEIDTFENTSDQFWNMMPQEHSGNIFIYSAFVDEGNIVGVYSKTSTYCPTEPRDHDSVFFFRMDFQGNFLDKVGYETSKSGMAYHLACRRYHMVKTETGYQYFVQSSGGLIGYGADGARQGTVFYLDEHFNILNYKQFKHYNIIPNNQSNNTFYNISVCSSHRNTIYLATSARSKDDPSHDEDCRLYEYDNSFETSNPLPLLNYVDRGTPIWDMPAMYKAVDVANDGSVYFAYTLNVGWASMMDSWIIIERLDADLNTMSELYYELNGENDGIYSAALSITATNDGGVMLLLNSYDLEDSNHQWSTIVKFPQETFVDIKETHYDCHSLVTFYPNPVKEQLQMQFPPRRAAYPSGALRPARPPGAHAKQGLREHRHEPAACGHLHLARHIGGWEILFG